jgi:UDP-N-acetylmuramoyl-L-alanyl-D-glutamate--2,6-diaminopimelate ligase
LYLQELLTLAGIGNDGGTISSDRPVMGVKYDSRAIRPGDVFVAVPGTATDGHRFVDAAVRAGAGAVVIEDACAQVQSVPCVLVRSTRAALADLSAAFHGFPSSPLHLTGITGTDGKTTSVFMLSHVLSALGGTTGLLSTVAFKVADRWQDNALRQSTLEAPEIQAALAEMVTAGVTDAVLETTSHGLALDRVRGCLFDDAIVTNITSEHLEFHRTRERYIAAKALLLDAVRRSQAKPGRRFVAINCDDEGSAGLVPGSPVEVITFGLGEAAAFRATNVVCGAAGSTFSVHFDGRDYQASTQLPGMFNAYNCLGVLALVAGRGMSIEHAVGALASFAGVPGRMNRVDAGQDFTVIVDYAHTAASLEKVLTTLRPLARGRLIAVFGSAGERDREKRPAMGLVAAMLADLSVLTDEDPRMESSEAILEEIAAGARTAGARAGSDYHVVPDRRQAIRWAFSQARSGDVVLLAGKGHEKNMVVRGASIPWDEIAVAREELHAL